MLEITCYKFMRYVCINVFIPCVDRMSRSLRPSMNWSFWRWTRPRAAGQKLTAPRLSWPSMWSIYSGARRTCCSSISLSRSVRYVRVSHIYFNRTPYSTSTLTPLQLCSGMLHVQSFQPDSIVPHKPTL